MHQTNEIEYTEEQRAMFARIVQEVCVEEEEVEEEDDQQQQEEEGG